MCLSVCKDAIFKGSYSMYSEGCIDQTWLRGVQVTDTEDKVTFKTIIPGCHTGRWPHLHFEVFSSIADITDSTNTILTLQIVVPLLLCNVAFTVNDYSGSFDQESFPADFGY